MNRLNVTVEPLVRRNLWSWARVARLIEPGRIVLWTKLAYTARPETSAAKSKKAWGRSHDRKAPVQGNLDQMAGTAQDLYGQTADAAQDTGENLDKWLRRADQVYGQTADATGNIDKRLRAIIETQPYRTAIVALGIGWLLGRVRRPF